MSERRYKREHDQAIYAEGLADGRAEADRLREALREAMDETESARVQRDQLREDVRLALSEHGTYNDLIERLHCALGDTPDECQE
jgi:hypothetical protein